ncbi:MAG TPA: hypothetical protein VGX23_07520 [Actinocrinis sp.]|nr:hypothetical protein [Actinocrinis sp.]
MSQPLPATAYVRVSPATFDPRRFAEVEALSTKQAEYLIPALTRLPGIIHHYVGVSPEGSIVHVSIWDTEEHALQLSGLKEMAVIARGEMEAIGVTFGAIVNYPLNWTI